MTGQERSADSSKRLVLGLEEKEIIPYLFHLIPPVSIDTLSALSGAPAVKVLNVMEDLKKRRFVYEKKVIREGTYFLNGTDLAAFVQKEMPNENMQGVVRKIIEFYIRTLHEGKEKTLALAELYMKAEQRC